MFSLSKKFQLIRPEYERLQQAIFQFPILERCYTEINELTFRLMYISKYHPEDTERMEAAFQRTSDLNRQTTENWGIFIAELLQLILDEASGHRASELVDFYTDEITLDSESIGISLHIFAEDRSVLEYLDDTIGDDEILHLYPDEYYRFSADSYNDAIESYFPEKFPHEAMGKIGKDDDAIYCHNFTFQTSENCNLNCTYCYQGNKSPNKMTFEIGKRFVDELLAGSYGYINDRNSPALIIEFIGGDPFLEMPLTRKIYEYFLERCYQLDHPWFEFHRISLCSNGLLYFDRDVQEFFNDFYPKISFNISIDGNRELHDACRIQPNGEGSYDIDMAALKHYCEHYAREKNSKMTLAPSNIKYLFESVVDFISQGMTVINLNCIFEEGWTVETARTEYEQLKLLANYLLDHDLEHLFIAIFSDAPDELWDKSFDGNWCGGTGAMLSMGPDGKFYPCLRYMPSSIGDDCPKVQIGDVQLGLEGRDQGSEILGIFDRITRRSQSCDICYNCPIGSGCSWCSACCHQSNGTANKRTTFHCIQTIAESLANVYYWNLLNIKKPGYNLGVRQNNVPDEWALKIISEDELQFLKAIENRSAIATIDHASEVN